MCVCKLSYVYPAACGPKGQRYCRTEWRYLFLLFPISWPSPVPKLRQQKQCVTLAGPTLFRNPSKPFSSTLRAPHYSHLPRASICSLAPDGQSRSDPLLQCIMACLSVRLRISPLLFFVCPAQTIHYGLVKMRLSHSQDAFCDRALDTYTAVS